MGQASLAVKGCEIQETFTLRNGKTIRLRTEPAERLESACSAHRHQAPFACGSLAGEDLMATAAYGRRLTTNASV